MLKQVAEKIDAGRFADTAFAKSRQVWLAGLGAAGVAREWARDDAGHVFRALVKEGSTVEKRMANVISKQIDMSISVATTALTRARETAMTAVNGLVQTAVASMPKVKVSAPAKSKRVKRQAVRKARRGRRAASRA
jgi:poly(hydroxyalkanoate) granule-associated protein